MPLQFEIAISFFSLEFHSCYFLFPPNTSTIVNLACEQAEGSVPGLKGREGSG